MLGHLVTGSAISATSFLVNTGLDLLYIEDNIETLMCFRHTYGVTQNRQL